jgi:hypothetical protein
MSKENEIKSLKIQCAVNLKQINCRWEALQRMVKSGTINKDNIINIQRIYPDDDIYFIYYWA